jgi:hypothetical protein
MVYEIDETVKLLINSIEKNKKKFSKGRNQNKKAAFETLKAKMVVTTGDNYGGSR